ncbi:trimeric intracellular cation channel family protein [Mucilaginibacter flavidus]|uniref:trimeric intracellular cation channel family protein n=1 Tax=Mucilaginibacter flavidus TaxID=2949309 RepID=UPI002093DDBB|nr:trimeric intracellular cation channel family protein [Mucilaginibacter flavidus]
MQKKLDLFGVLIIGFVTAVGGGTIRDVLIGNTPVTWMKDIITPLIILGTAIVTIFFKQLVKNLKVTLFLFDALGLGLFTVIGIQKGLDAGLNPGICVALGTITGCFGGVLRDLLLSQIPVLFQKEIYATACIIGGTVYVLSLSFINQQFAEAIAVILICGIRILAVRLNWKLPSIKI